MLNTVESGSYVLTGCVTVTNRDSDPQWASVSCLPRLGDALPLAPPEVLFDVTPPYQMPGNSSTQFYVQAPFRQEADSEMFTIDCNTYDGTAKHGSLIALLSPRIHHRSYLARALALAYSHTPSGCSPGRRTWTATPKGQILRGLCRRRTSRSCGTCWTR